jgi:hypothetical protein
MNALQDLHEPAVSWSSTTLSPLCGERAGRGVLSGQFLAATHGLAGALFLLAALGLSPSPVAGAVWNLKVVTDASPDYADLDSLIYSATSAWPTPAEKCWALFYWNHQARRQTAPMIRHGLAVTDPIRQFNDYGYTMCSTVAGINCALWQALGLKAKYWDISNHTVPEVEYDGAWHMYDNSMSALYTRCDGRTLASVAEIGREGGCAASQGRIERGHIARYHCLHATSPNGFLTGADTSRSLEEESRCFNPNGLKYRSYFYDWDYGHRYILNLREEEAYTRYYHSLGKGPEYFVPNEGKDPEQANPRYRLRGNGVRAWPVPMTAAGLRTCAHRASDVVLGDQVTPAQAGRPGEVVFKIEGANVITRLDLIGSLFRRTAADVNRISISTVNGLTWQDIWENDQTGQRPVDLKLTNQVNGAYEVLVKFTLLGRASPADARLDRITFHTFTMLNSKTQPQLLLGKNLVHVRVGEPAESIVLWPELQGEGSKPYLAELKNMTTAATHPGYLGVMHAVNPREEASVTFRVDAPRDATRLQYGGRLYCRARGSRIDFLHSLDGGRTWQQTYSLTNTAQPWDVIRYETVSTLPPGTRSVLFRYRLNSSEAGPDACSLYAVRMEVNHQPADVAFKPLEVTFRWSERQQDYSLVERSHTELVSRLPHRYTVNVGGADHPVVHSLRVGVRGAEPAVPQGYSDGRDAGGEKFVPRWVTWGTNLAQGRAYTVSVPSNTQWGAGDPAGRKLTDGVVGAPYAGGTGPTYALGWDKGTEPEITVDLGQVQICGAFRIQVGAGWPWWDALKGEVKDRVELLTSGEGRDYASQGFFNLNLRWKDLPVNHLWPDDEVIGAHLFELVPPAPVPARFVRFKLTPQRSLTVSEVQVFDRVSATPFDLRISLPKTGPPQP